MPARTSIRYTRARRLTLAVSIGFVVGVPAWHLAHFAADGTIAPNVLSAVVALIGGSSVASPVVGAPWSVSLFGLELLDPLAALGVLVAGGASWGVLTAALPTLLLVALLGRFFCGWLCPYVPVLAASNSARALLERWGWKAPDVRLPRGTPLLVLATVLAVTAVAGVQLAPLVYPPSAIGRETFKAVFLGGYGLGIALVVAAFAFDTFVSKAGFCRSLCPGGALFSLLGAFSFVRVERDEASCIDCGICDNVCNLGQLPMTDIVGMGCERCGGCVAACPTEALGMSLARRPALLVEVERLSTKPAFSPSRRAFVVAGGATVLGAVAPRGEVVRLRPPGAAEGRAFERSCIRCFRCAEVCPVGAIRFDSPLDLAGIDTPFIDPGLQPCVLCMACTEVCPTDALSPIAAELDTIAAEVRMGVPVLDKRRCLAWSGKAECNACWQACPLPDIAVEMVGLPRQAPAFRDDACVGCGLCEKACPTRATAIRIEPRRAA